MTAEYSIDVSRLLERKFTSAGLYRPMRVDRFEQGTELCRRITTLENSFQADVRICIEKFVGGGFAGQVYQVRLLQMTTPEGDVQHLEGLSVGGIYAMKILVPASSFSKFFRNFIYAVGFQSPFQLQVNPAAARAGALWQKFIRRAASVHFGEKKSVVDIHATFVDENLGSCGELSEWVQGRTWRMEVDDYLDVLNLWRKKKTIDPAHLGSPEYRSKKIFMADFVKLLHEIGAHEFARQYEWTTCKSQPNCLKRSDTNSDPEKGLVAVDFRAGLALLPFLPMSPGDFKLIGQGLLRGSLVQFDRGSIGRLERFVDEHKYEFSGMGRMLDELKAVEKIYRDSMPDITHNHCRLLFSPVLWKTMLDSAVTGWKVRNLIDDEHEKSFRNSGFLTILFFIAGLVPFLGGFTRKIWAHGNWRKHYVSILTSPAYLLRAIRGKIAETLIRWHRAGRVGRENALKLADRPVRFCCHLPMSLLPAGLHRFLTDSRFRKEKLVFIFVRPFRLYFHAALREQWLKDMVAQGGEKHILSDEDAKVILSQVNEPFIQKYLVSLVVHLMTLPVTQMVSVSIAVVYYFTHRDQPNAWAIGLGIIGLFQVIPISPGSLCRGFYVLYLVLKERNFKDYNIAVFLGFFKYVGYLAFPIQMTYRYPALARFMAAHWATDAVHIVPVFGERGALLEHWVFRLFYNWPLTIKRRMTNRSRIRKTLPPRYWHVPLCGVLSLAAFALGDWAYIRHFDQQPAMRDVWYMVLLIPLACGSLITLAAGGAELYKRIIPAAIAGLSVGLIYPFLAVVLPEAVFAPAHIVKKLLWSCFLFTLLAAVGVLVTEILLPDPDLRKR